MTWKIWTIAPVLALAACAEETATENAANLAELPTGNKAPPSPDGNGGGGGTAPGDDQDGDGGNGVGDPDMAWNFNTTARGPKLAYGVPQTDNVRLTLRCAGSDRIELSFMRGEAGGEQMTVRSGGASESVSATAQETQLGGYVVAAELPANAAPLERFRAGNPLTVEYAGESRAVPPSGEADRLFNSC